MGTARGALLALLLAGCAHPPAPATGPPADPDFGPSFALATPGEAGLDGDRLIALAEAIRDRPLPIYSFLISRHGKLAFELYTSELERDQAHYLMSVTKTFDSALLGIAIDRGLVAGPDAPVTDVLPRRLFDSDERFAQFHAVTIKRITGMSAIDAIDPPRTHAPEAVERQRRFVHAPDRVAFVAGLPLLDGGFQYNDYGPALAAGVIQYASGKTALDFARSELFGPLGFRNADWMHQDEHGIDMGGYGLRVRPIDLQKLGVLYLDGGVWNGRRILSRAWIDQSFTPWNRSRPGAGAADYGWFWWSTDHGDGLIARSAKGWKGQRIEVFPGEGLVVTMTGCFEDGREDVVFDALVRDFVRPALRPPVGHAPADPRLARVLAEVRASLRIAPSTEWRMIPSVRPKERRRPFVP